jgi:hypothetical protein
MPLSGRARQIVERLRKSKVDFGDGYPKKFGGAAAIEVLRAELQEEGVQTSSRDVYVKGFSSEIDLLVPHNGASPWLELLYEPRDVAVALEVKKTGTYGEKGRDKIKDDFTRLDKLGVQCAYITFEERVSYCYRPTSEWLGFPCFALAWHNVSDGPLVPVNEGEDWEAFVRFLHNAVGRRRSRPTGCS